MTPIDKCHMMPHLYNFVTDGCSALSKLSIFDDFLENHFFDQNVSSKVYGNYTQESTREKFNPLMDQIC